VVRTVQISRSDSKSLLRGRSPIRRSFVLLAATSTPSTALTRRAKKASRLSAIVVRWSRSRKRYERQGILAESDAIDRAERECLSDAEARGRRRERDQVRRADEDVRFQDEFATAIREAFPGCPAGGPTRSPVTRQPAAAVVSDAAAPREPWTRRRMARRRRIGAPRRHRLRQFAHVGRQPRDRSRPGARSGRRHPERLAATVPPHTRRSPTPRPPRPRI
jgi:hypothetical protein